MIFTIYAPNYKLIKIPPFKHFPEFSKMILKIFAVKFAVVGKFPMLKLIE